MNSSRPGATGMFGSKWGSVKWWAVVAVCTSAGELLVALEGGLPASPAAACQLAIKSSASVEQRWRIRSFTSEDLHLWLFNDVAHKAASIPQSSRLLFSRAIEA